MPGPSGCSEALRCQTFIDGYPDLQQPTKTVVECSSCGRGGLWWASLCCDWGEEIDVALSFLKAWQVPPHAPHAATIIYDLVLVIEFV